MDSGIQARVGIGQAYRPTLYSNSLS